MGSKEITEIKTKEKEIEIYDSNAIHKDENSYLLGTVNFSNGFKLNGIQISFENNKITFGGLKNNG